MSVPKIIVTKDGPYIVSGNLPLKKEIIGTDMDGNPVEWIPGDNVSNGQSYSLCRCGKSKNKPFCDGSHIKEKFDGTETAERKDYFELAEKIDGPDLILTDAKSLCSLARFCDACGGIWELTKNSDNLQSKEIAIQQGCDCPSGRLVTWDKKSLEAHEPEFEKSISLIQDPSIGVSGPIWAKGGIIVESSDGYQYQVRNRVTLCRCGKSKNKPFCDGCHIKAGFTDEN